MELMTALTWLVYGLLGLSILGAIVGLGVFAFIGYQFWKNFKGIK